MNSFLHHIDDENTERTLSHVEGLLTKGGHVHIMDLVMPSKPCIARLLARLDRGDHPRPMEHWKKLFTKHFSLCVFEEYKLKLLGTTLWNMVYFKGGPRHPRP